MERGSWKPSDDFWNTAATQKSDNYPTKTMPAHVPQTSEMAFSVSGSSSSSLYSSMESVESENNNEVNMNQKNVLKNQETYRSGLVHREIGDSVQKLGITASSHFKSKNNPPDISERQMNIDDNNNVCRIDNYSEIEKTGESGSYSSTKYLGIQSPYDHQIQMKGKSGTNLDVHGGYGIPANQRNMNVNVQAIQKQSRAVDNLHCKDQLDELETNDKLSELKTNMAFGPGQKTNDITSMQRKDGFGIPNTNKPSMTIDKGSLGRTTTNENRVMAKGGFGKPSGSEQNSTSNKGGFGQPRPDLSVEQTKASYKSGFGNQNTTDQTKMKNKGGFGRPNAKSDTFTNQALLSENPDNQNTIQRYKVNSQKQLTPETENWDEEIVDFPSDIKQTYSYGLDHVKFPTSKNLVISEKELIATHKKELHFKRTEPMKEVLDLDDTPELKKTEKDQRNLPTSAVMEATFVPRNAVVEARNIDAKPNITEDTYVEPHTISPKESHVESNRRLQVLKDLSKSPDLKKFAKAAMSAHTENRIHYEPNYNPENQHYSSNQELIDTDPVIKSSMKAGFENSSYEESKRTEKETEPAELQGEREIPKPEEPPVNIARKSATPEKDSGVTVPPVGTEDSPKPASVAAQTSNPTDTTTSQGSADMPAGLPPHLMQAYLQYLAQSGTDTTPAAQNTGLMGGLLPGLGVGLGMPLVSPFATPLYNPMMPFGMNPFMMNPLMALSLQTQQQQLAGQLGATLTNNNANAVQAEYVEAKTLNQTEETEQKKETTDDGSDGAVKKEIEQEYQVSAESEVKMQDSVSENIVPLFRSMNIQSHEAIKEQPMLEDKEAYSQVFQGDGAITRPNCPNSQVDNLFRNSEIIDNVSPPGKTENMMPAHDVDNIRIRRPSKEQNCSLRIPREPSVSSRLYGVQSSPVTDDPAVIRMSSAEVSGTNAFVDHNRQEIRSATFDEDPSIIRFEQKSVAHTSPEKDNEPDSDVAMKVDDFPKKYDMRGWMNNGPSIVRTVQNNGFGREITPAATSDSQPMRSVQNPGVNQDSANRFPAPLAIPSRSYPSSQIPAAGLGDFGDRRPQTCQPMRGRGGFGTPSMPKRPPTTNESDTTSNSNQIQNPARPSFNTRSLSERFAGIKREGGEGFSSRQFPPRQQEAGNGYSSRQFPPRPQAGGDGFSARKLPPRLQAQREKNQQVKDMISQLRKETEASQQAGDVLHIV